MDMSTMWEIHLPLFTSTQPNATDNIRLYAQQMVIASDNLQQSLLPEFLIRMQKACCKILQVQQT